MDNPPEHFKKHIIEYVDSLIAYYEQELVFMCEDNARLEKKLAKIKEHAIQLESKLA